MRKAKVTICVGTACYVLGGAEILSQLEELKAAFGDKVEWDGAPCLGLCKCGKENKAPFATVNGKVVEKATMAALEASIQEALAGKENGHGE